jgi:hypothetical protein
LFREATGSVWMPGYNYDFWAVPYLMGKGASMEQIVDMHRAVTGLMQFNEEKPVTPAGSTARAGYQADLESLFRTMRLRPPRYRMPLDQYDLSKA